MTLRVRHAARAGALVVLLAGLAAPLPAETPTARGTPAPATVPPPAVSGDAVAAPGSPPVLQNVRMTATLLVVDREAVRRAGLSYVVLGPDRVRLSPLDERRGPARGVRAQVGALGVRAFLDAVRTNRWASTETTQHVLALSGSPARVSSTDLTIGRFTTRSQGPVLSVLPTILEDGRVHLRVSARIEDVATDPYWGHTVDGSPVSVDTELIVHAGEEVIIASGSRVESSRASGLLHLSSADRERDVLVVITAVLAP